MKLRLVPQWVKRLFQSPIKELSRWQFALRFLLEVCRHGAGQLREARASQMAAALAFRTIFGMVPLVIMAALLFRGIGGDGVFADLVERILIRAGLQDVGSPDQSLTLAEWTRSVVQDISAGLSTQTVGVIGGLVLVWGAIGVLTTIERSFNQVCQSRVHRSLARRIPLYWTTVTIGPALLYLGFEAEHRLEGVVQAAALGETLASVLGSAISFCFAWLFLLSLYIFVPHTRVNLAAAGVGSFVAAAVWTAAIGAFGWYIGWSFSADSSALSVLYGSLGLIPVFLLWIYFLWLIVLYGLEITHILQVVGGRMDQALPVHPKGVSVLDPAVVVPVVQHIAERFARGFPTSPDDLAEHTDVDLEAIGVFLEALVHNGVLHIVSGKRDDGYVLAKPPDQILTNDLLRIVQDSLSAAPPESSNAWRWVHRFREAYLDWGQHKPITEL